MSPLRAPRARRHVLVLGGTGLLGSAVVRELVDAGHRVRAVARNEPSSWRLDQIAGAELVVGDAVSPLVLHDAMDGVEHVVDALGAPHPAASANAPVAQFGAELPGLLGVLDELKSRPGVGLTYLSSGGAIYGNPATLPVPEDAACHPLSPYGITKLAAERYVLIAVRQGLDARILRVANAYGCFQRPRTGQGLVAALLHAASSEEPVELFGDGTQVRDYVDVRDVASAVVALLDAGGDAVLNVGSGTGHRVADVVALVEAATGLRVPVRRLPSRPTDVREIVLDTTRLSELVPWRPRPLEVGLPEMWATWLEWARLERAAVPEPR